MTSLRAQFTRELTIRGRAARTIQAYLACVASLAKHYHRSPDRIADEEIREWLAHLRTGLSAVPQRHLHTVQALIRCGTGELGYTVHACQDCGHQENIPRGCGNRHCPCCQGRLARAWLARQQADLLDTPYFHVVCTLPHALLPLCAAAPRELYALLFEAAAQTLLQLGRERLGGTIGLTAILANHLRKREIPKARTAIARKRRRVCNVLRDNPSAGAQWQPACPHCGGTRVFCVALIQPDGRMIELPALARLSLLRPRAPP